MENEEKKALYLPEGTAPRELADAVIGVLDSKKARGIKLLYVENKTIIADYFVICSGTSNTQIRALANEVEFMLGEAGVLPSRTEGLTEAIWVVLDYASVIVHIFNSEARNFYNLEKLWKDADEVDISALLTEK